MSPTRSARRAQARKSSPRSGGPRPDPSDPNLYRDQTVRVVDLPIVRGIVTGLKFVDCTLEGPAVVVMNTQTTIMVDVIFGLGERGDVDSILWEVPASRSEIVGAIGFDQCVFERVLFKNLGFAGPPDVIALMRTRISSGPRRDIDTRES